MKYPIIIPLALLLSACGGGSSSDATTTSQANEQAESPQPAGKEQDTQPPVISISGSQNLTVTFGENYQDEGATAVDDVDGTVSVTSEGSVNSQQVGVYTIRYIAVDKAGNSSTLERTVNVVPVQDQQAPQLSLNGESSVKLALGASYQELGANAVDNIDGEVTVVIENGVVDTSRVGETEVVYSATDGQGNKATMSRIVKVAKPKILSLDKQNTLVPGATVTASSVCEYCDPAKTQYTWTVKTSDSDVYRQSGKDFMMTPVYAGQPVTLSVTAFSERGSDSDTQYVTYQPVHISELVQSSNSFAALMTDGSVSTWGFNWLNDGNYQDGIRDDVRPLLSDVTMLASSPDVRNGGLFAAQRSNGVVFSWGDPKEDAKNGWQFEAKKLKWLKGRQDIIAGLEESGLLHIVFFDCASGSGECIRKFTVIPYVKEVVFSNGALAALTTNQSLYTYGDSAMGGDFTLARPYLKTVKAIYSNNKSFTALNTDGSAVSWGDPSNGGDSSSVQEKLVNIREVQAAEGGYIALTQSGEVVVWGDISKLDDRTQLTEPLTGIESVAFNGFAFAGLKNDGTVLTWGLPENAGFGADSATEQANLNNANKIISLPKAFAAYHDDNQITFWGKDTDGVQPSANNPDVYKQLYEPARTSHWALKFGSAQVLSWNDICDVTIDEEAMLSGIDKTASKGNYNVAVKQDGSAFVWGSMVFDTCSGTGRSTYTNIEVTEPYLEGVYFVTKDKELIHFGDSTVERERRVNQIDLTPVDRIIDKSAF